MDNVYMDRESYSFHSILHVIVRANGWSYGKYWNMFGIGRYLRINVFFHYVCARVCDGNQKPWKIWNRFNYISMLFIEAHLFQSFAIRFGFHFTTIVRRLDEYVYNSMMCISLCVEMLKSCGNIHCTAKLQQQW